MPSKGGGLKQERWASRGPAGEGTRQRMHEGTCMGQELQVPSELQREASGTWQGGCQLGGPWEADAPQPGKLQ